MPDGPPSHERLDLTASGAVSWWGLAANGQGGRADGYGCRKGKFTTPCA